MITNSYPELDVEDFNSKLPNIDDRIQLILSKALRILELVNNFGSDSNADIFTNLISTIKDKSISFECFKKLNSEKVIKGLCETCDKIFNALDYYSLSLSNTTISPDDKKDLISKLKIDVDNYNKSLSTFLSNLENISNSISKLTHSSESDYQEDLKLLTLRVCLECFLFSFCVNVEKIDEYPFFNSNFIRIYHHYNTITSVSDNIALLHSYCGTGKTICTPIILFCKNLKEGNHSPFILMALKDPYHVIFMKKMFKESLSSISEFIKITSETKEIEEIYNNYKSNRKYQKLTFGLLTTYNLLPLMFNLRNNEHFIPHTRFIIDEINQKSCHICVILSQFLELSKANKTLPLNFVLLSSIFPKKIIDFFGDSAKVTTLVEKPLYDIIDEPVQYEKSVKIERVVKKTLYRMAETSKNNTTSKQTKVEEGNILCFLPSTFQCQQLRKQMIKSIFNDKKKTNRKIVILRTTLDTNESDENYINRLIKEYKDNENIREKDGYIHPFLYFIVFSVSGITDTRIMNIVHKKFPNELKNINKLIFSTPINETLNISGLSVVIDSGLIKEEIFDCSTCLTKFVEKQASNESMSLRKGRLGRSMKGLYISFSQRNKKDYEIQAPSIQIHDLTKNYLLMKQIKIDLDKMNLPYKPNFNNLQFAIDTLKNIGAIDDKSLEITKLGNQILKFDFIPISYYAAVVKYAQSFSDENDKNYAYFISAFISLMITMERLLIKDEKAEGLIELFDDDSDLVTLFNALCNVLKYYNDEDNQLFKQNYFKKAKKGLNKNKLQNDNIGRSQSLHPSNSNDNLKESQNHDINRSHSLHSNNNNNSNDDSKSESQNNDISRTQSLGFNNNDDNNSISESQNSDISRTQSLGLIDEDSINESQNNNSTAKPKFKQTFKPGNPHNRKKQNNKPQFIIKAEFYGFAPYQISKFIQRLLSISNFLFPNKDSKDIINDLTNFIQKNGIYKIIDDFIEKFDENWKEIHSFQFKIARRPKSIKTPELVFLGSDKLIFTNVNEGQTNGKIFITKRPGWKGIVIPSQIYCFNISNKMEVYPYQKYVGHLIHRKTPCPKGFDAIEYKSRYIFNPWFNVLLETYFGKNLERNNGKTSDVISFYPSRVSEKIILSFINKDNMKEKITEAVDKCVKLLPFTPRSVLIYKESINTITEVKSIGSEDYFPMNSTFCRGARLNKDLIEHCINNLNEIICVNAKIRICSLFINDTCEPGEYDTSNLYVIDMLNKKIDGIDDLLSVVNNRYKEMKNKIKKRTETVSSQNSDKYGFFQFSPRLVHPSLFYHEEAQKCIMNWFNEKFPNVNIKENKGHKFKLKLDDLHEVQKYINKNITKIEEEMQLDYAAISFPLEILKTIKKEHEDWYIEKKYRTIITKKEKLNEINDYIKEKRLQTKNKKAHSYFVNNNVNPTFCYNGCANPENPKLTDSPITYYFENGETYSSKLCLNCIYNALCHATQTFYINDKVNVDLLELIKTRPQRIIRMPSHYCDNGRTAWPQIPFGQLISVLFDNDDPKLSSLVSAYLHSINEFTIRNKMNKYVTFCQEDNHRHSFIKVLDDDAEIKCNAEGCENYYCRKCMRMHKKDFICIFQETNSLKLCPECNCVIEKIGGCDIVECECGAIFSFEYGKGFETYFEADMYLLAHKNKYSFLSSDDEINE